MPIENAARMIESAGSNPSPPTSGSAVASATNEPPRWNQRFWDNERHVSLQFATTDELDTAIDWLWSAPELRDMPRVHVGRNTMIVPAQAAELFRQRGFQFIIGQVRSMGDLSPAEAKRVRQSG